MIAELQSKNAIGIWELHPSEISQTALHLKSANWTGNFGVLIEQS